MSLNNKYDIVSLLCTIYIAGISTSNPSRTDIPAFLASFPSAHGDVSRGIESSSMEDMKSLIVKSAPT